MTVPRVSPIRCYFTLFYSSTCEPGQRKQTKFMIARGCGTRRLAAAGATENMCTRVAGCNKGTKVGLTVIRCGGHALLLPAAACWPTPPLAAPPAAAVTVGRTITLLPPAVARYEGPAWGLLLLLGLLLPGDSGRITASACLRDVVLMLPPPLLLPGGLLLGLPLLPQLLLPPLPPPPLLPVRSPGRRSGGAEALAAAAAAKPLDVLADLRAALAARSAAAAASAGDAAAGELKSASPTISQRMVRAAARDATAWPMLSGRRSASARSSGDSVCKGQTRGRGRSWDKREQAATAAGGQPASRGAGAATAGPLVAAAGASRASGRSHATFHLPS